MATSTNRSTFVTAADRPVVDRVYAQTELCITSEGSEAKETCEGVTADDLIAELDRVGLCITSEGSESKETCEGIAAGDLMGELDSVGLSIVTKEGKEYSKGNEYSLSSEGVSADDLIAELDRIGLCASSEGSEASEGCENIASEPTEKVPGVELYL